MVSAGRCEVIGGSYLVRGTSVPHIPATGQHTTFPKVYRALCRPNLSRGRSWDWDWDE